MRTLSIIILLAVSLLSISVPAGSEEAGEKRVLKIMTINVRHNSDFWEERFPLIADEIVRLKPDIIGLQEVEIGINQSRVLRSLIKEKSAAAGGEMKYRTYEHLKTGSDMMSGEGVSILSRYPIIKKDYADLKNGRPALFSRVKVSETLAVDMFNTHLHHRGGDEVRLPQAEIMTDFIAKHDRGYIAFLTGDMNARPESETIKHLLDSGFTDSFTATPKDSRAGGENTSPVYLSKTPVPQAQLQRIDYVLFKPGAGAPGIRPVSSEVCFRNHAENGLYPSDHLGVMTTFEITME